MYKAFQIMSMILVRLIVSIKFAEEESIMFVTANFNGHQKCFFCIMFRCWNIFTNHVYLGNDE